MNERDELATALSKVRHVRALHLEVSASIVTHVMEGITDALLAAGYRRPRTITTVEELDALIAESVVRSDAGIIYERYADEDGPEFDYWLIPGEPRAQASTKIDLPALVIFDPEPLS